MPAYKVTVMYHKNANEDFNMNSDEDGVVLKAGETKSEKVSYSFSLLYYTVMSPKDGEQIMIMPQFETTPELQKKGKTFVLYNQGQSEYTITGTDLQLIKSPFGRMPSKGKEMQRYYSDAPLPPAVSFLFKNNELVFFSGGVEFPEKEESLSPVGSSFSSNEKDSIQVFPDFPLKPVKVTESNSPYKWVYQFIYTKEGGYNKEGKVFSMGRKDMETATVQIWKSF